MTSEPHDIHIVIQLLYYLIQPLCYPTTVTQPLCYPITMLSTMLSMQLLCYPTTMLSSYIQPCYPATMLSMQPLCYPTTMLSSYYKLSNHYVIQLLYVIQPLCYPATMLSNATTMLSNHYVIQPLVLTLTDVNKLKCLLLIIPPLTNLSYICIIILPFYLYLK